MIDRVLLVRTDFGRWVWWPALGIVDYIPKGRRNAALSARLREGRNTEVEALRAVVRALSRQRG